MISHFGFGGGVNRRPPDANSVPTIAERRRLIEAHRAATQFFRRELLRQRGWADDYLVSGGARVLLTSDSTWTVGYAPDSRSRLVDHLRARGFDMETVRNAGLGVLSPEGRMVDRFRDQVMFPSWNDRLETVGYFGVRRGVVRPYYVASPATQIHRRSNALMGVAEQHDLLSEGAAPVLVNHPLDAVAIEQISRLAAGRWAGIPLCDTLLSAEQARILGRYAATDTAIVVLADDSEGQRAAVGFLDDLSRLFTRVWAVELPSGHSASALITSEGGQQRLHDSLLVHRPLSDYRQPRKWRRPLIRLPAVDPNPPDQSPAP